MEKVKLTKEQANDLENLVNRFSTNEALIKQYCKYSENNKFHVTRVEGSADWSLGLEKLIKALYIGYEVEQTPEEVIKEVYLQSVIKSGKIGCKLDRYTTEILIPYLLNQLNIKIKGINE